MGFKKNNPGCMCCGGGDPPACIVCQAGTTPSHVQVVIPAIGNGTCDCSNIGGTYILPQEGARSCHYSLEVEIDMGACGTYTYTITAWFSYGIGRERRNVIINKNGDPTDSAEWSYSVMTSDPFDCSVARTIPFFYSASGSGPCAWDSISTAVEWTSLYL